MEQMEQMEQTQDMPVVNRKRQSFIKTSCTVSEYEQIKANAKQAGMSVARYMREVAMGYPVQSVEDKKAVLELVRINSDLARLGNLQKLWLDNDARTARFGTDQINRLLHRIEGAQSELRRLIKSVSGVKSKA